jgi:nucleotide-binding universal stress UspA family protein
LYIGDDGGQTAGASAERAGTPFRQLTGDPRARIIEEAGASDVIAIAVGARGKRHARSAGHLARQLADAIDKPILVVPPDGPPRERVHTVVIAMEGTPGKARALKRAVEVAAGAELDVVVVHVDDETSIPRFSDQVAHETDAYATEFLARYVPGVPKARLELRIGVPADEILDVIHAATADLLAIGWPPPSESERGDVAQELLDRSPVPLLLVAMEPSSQGGLT